MGKDALHLEQGSLENFYLVKVWFQKNLYLVM